MKNGFFLSLIVLQGLFLLGSCTDESFVENEKNVDVPKNADKMLIGEWAEIKTESYNWKNELIQTSFGDSKKVKWIFAENGYFYDEDNEEKGSYIFSNKKIVLNGNEEEKTYNVQKLTKDSLVVLHRYKYEEGEKSHRIIRYSRLSIYDDSDVELSEEQMKFVGKWSDGGSHYWYFLKNGDLLVGKDKDINQGNYITKQSWSYDPLTRTMATNAHWRDVWGTDNYTYGNFVYAWTVLVSENDFWTGLAMYANKTAVTFTKVE